MKTLPFRILILSALVVAISILALACEKDDKCDTNNVSYKDDIVPILQKNGCYASGCHGASDTYSYDTHAKLKFVADAQRLVGAVKREPGFSPMPKNGSKLDECSINLIEAWVKQGAKDN